MLDTIGKYSWPGAPDKRRQIAANYILIIALCPAIIRHLVANLETANVKSILTVVLPSLWVPVWSLMQINSFRNDPILASMSFSETVFMTIAIGLIIGLVSMAAIGLPLHYFLQRRHWQKLRTYLVTGLFAGIFVRVLFIGLVWLQIVMQTRNAPLQFVVDRMIEAWTDRPIVFLNAALIGTLAFGTLWWWVRPDRIGRTTA